MPIGDLIFGEVPGQEETNHDHQQDADAGSDDQQYAGCEVPVLFGFGREVTGAEDIIERILAEEVEERHHDEPAPDHGGDRVDPPPGGRLLHPGLRRLIAGHSPASLASPRAERRSRSRVPSEEGRPGISALAEVDAV